ncbi:M1 family metallopeptidase [Flagellimonas sp. 2504JD1-5]
MKLGLTLIFFLSLQLLGAQIQDKVDFIRAEVFVEPLPKEKSIKGTVRYEFKVLKDVDSIFLDAHNMDFSSVMIDLKKVNYRNNARRISIRKKFKKGNTHFIVLSYKAIPKQTVYFLGYEDNVEGNEQIWTQGQGKYTSHWLPSFDDMNEKVEFDVSFPSSNVIANGSRKVVNNHGGGFYSTFEMQNPMSSYLLGFAIGNFDKIELQSTSGVPIGLYYEPKDSLKVEPTYRYSKRIFDFLENQIGIPYPWQNYKQVPVQDFLYAGMENTGATIFSNTFMVDSIAFVDKNFVNVNAHEMAHQWFGNLVTEQSGKHHWLHEGFATYYAYLAEKDIFGDDYFYWHLLETARALDNFSGEGNGEALIDPSAGSLTFYEKGAWALLMLRDRVGDDNFKQGIKNYLNKYSFKNVTIADFMWEMEKASGMKLSDFEEKWLQESEFPFAQVKEFLIHKNPSIRAYFELKDSIGDMTTFAERLFKEQWSQFTSNYLKYQLLLDYSNELSPGFLKWVLENEDLKVRQAIALALKKVPKSIQKEFESLIEDKSYKTIEAALFRLWSDFPDLRSQYLDSTSEVLGLPNKNIRLLWLTLALVTPEYNEALKPNYFKELSGYTSSEHHFEVRLLAFQYLKSIGAFSDETVKNLVEACDHHVWHFKKSCRKMLKEFLKEDKNRERLMGIYPTLSLEQQQYIDKTLGK